MSGWGLSSVKLTWAYNELQQKYDVSDGYNDIQERYDTDIAAETQMNATLQQQLQVHIDRQAKQVSGHKKGASEQGRSLRGNTWKSNRTDLKKKKHRAAWEAQHWGKTPACPPHRKSEHWRTRCASKRRCCCFTGPRTSFCLLQESNSHWLICAVLHVVSSYSTSLSSSWLVRNLLLYYSLKSTWNTPESAYLKPLLQDSCFKISWLKH